MIPRAFDRKYVGIVILRMLPGGFPLYETGLICYK
jgi:hypothetical protein